MPVQHGATSNWSLICTESEYFPIIQFAWLTFHFIPESLFSGVPWISVHIRFTKSFQSLKGKFPIMGLNRCGCQGRYTHTAANSDTHTDLLLQSQKWTSVKLYCLSTVPEIREFSKCFIKRRIDRFSWRHDPCCLKRFDWNKLASLEDRYISSKLCRPIKRCRVWSYQRS